MTDLKVTFKNCPPELAMMVETAFQDVPAHIGEPALEMPADGLTIDFTKMTDQDLLADIIQSLHILVMGHSFLAMKIRDNEKQGH
jgi:hypothetical protein